jgi:hypothetical protein
MSSKVGATTTAALRGNTVMAVMPATARKRAALNTDASFVSCLNGIQGSAKDETCPKGVQTYNEEDRSNKGK